MAGRVVHFEIPFDNADRATGFYRSVFDWQLQSVPEMDYTMVFTGPNGDQGMPSEPGFINGGMFERNPQLGTPVIVVDVEDIDATLEQVEASGGRTVTPRQQVGDMGFAAYFTDPEGNLMGLWQSA